jgi:hypothetical protein
MQAIARSEQNQGSSHYH